MLVDVHAHLDHPWFSGKVDKVVSRCVKKNCYVVTSGVNVNTNRKALEISEKYKNVYCSLGLYPIDALASEMEHGEFPRSVEKLDVDDELKFILKNKKLFLLVNAV